MIGSLRTIASSSKVPRVFARAFTYSPSAAAPPRSSFTRPGPPQLSADDQAEFDALVKANEAVGATPAATAPAEDLENLAQHPDVKRGPKPDFEGDVNPKTGERGGPKVDPFKAGNNDWQYGGRVTVSAPTRLGPDYAQGPH